MKTFYKIENGKHSIGSGSKIPEGFTEYTIGQEPLELKALLELDTQAQVITRLKSLYLGVVQDKLDEFDYDSLATVKLWEGDATFGAEATRILTWYKAIIAKNYALLTAGVPMTDEEYLAQINAIVF